MYSLIYTIIFSRHPFESHRLYAEKKKYNEKSGLKERNTEKFYYDNHRVTPKVVKKILNIYQNDENRFHDPIYNNQRQRQIYTFGCSWTYVLGLRTRKNIYSFVR